MARRTQAHDSSHEDTSALVTAARDGDQHAFATLYRRHQSDLHGAVVSILRNRHDAEEIVHDTFLLAWQRLDTLADPASFGGWLVAIGRNRALNRRRKEMRSRPFDAATITDIFDDASPSSTPDPARVAEANADRDLVWSALQGLGERDRQALVLSLHKESGPSELAATLGISANLASQILHRLQGRMRTAIDAWTLWAHGRPACPTLATTLARRCMTDFDAATVAVVARHGRGCPTCSTQAEHRHLVAA